MELVPGQTVGSYRLVQPAGSGGMADVWRAYHPRLESYVAIKFLSPRYATDPNYLERFLREARAVSRLDHPNVLTVHDFGEQEGWTYMVSPYIGGGTLAARLRRGPWTVEEAIAVLEPLASALDYAHAEGLVHRDVKPSNVLFTERGRLILSDFGIARMIEGSTLMTQAGLVIGTPMYMSPEQADGERAGPASDLYSLGVVAYEMLTGRPPFTGETPLALLRAHVDRPLPPPRTLNPALPERVEAVLFTILAKSPDHRFRSGAAFVAALRASSGLGQPRAAVPPAAGTTPIFSDDVPPASIADVPRRAMPPAVSPPVVAPRPTPTGPTVPDRERPPSSAARPGQPPRLEVPAHQPRDLPPPPPPAWTRHLSRRNALIALGTLAVAGAGAATLRFTGAWPAPVRTLAAYGGAQAVAFTSDGATMASASSDGTVRLWRVADGTLLRTLLGTYPVTGVAFSPDGTLVASSSTDKVVRLWRVADGVLVRTLAGHSDSVLAVAYSPNGDLIASGGADSTVRFWRAADGQEIRTLGVPARNVGAVAFSPDGELVATGSSDSLIRLWRVDDGGEILVLRGHAGSVENLTAGVNDLAFSPDGRLLVSGGNDGSVRLWRVADGSPFRTLSGHAHLVSSVAFSPDGQLVASSSWDETVRLWRVADGAEVQTFGYTNNVRSVAFSPDGRLLASGADDNTVTLWRVQIPFWVRDAAPMEQPPPAPKPAASYPTVQPQASPSPSPAAAAAGQPKPAATAPAGSAAASKPAPPTATAPPQVARPPVSLANGTDVTPPQGTRGLGKLAIRNGTSQDAVAKLVEAAPSGQTRRFVYVRANADVTIEGIAVGTYRLLFMTGVDWDASTRVFLRDVSRSQFDEPFEFRETPTDGGTRVSTWEVSLNPVSGGSGRTSPVSPEAFGRE